MFCGADHLSLTHPLLLAVNLIKHRAIRKVLFTGAIPATKGLIDGEEVQLGHLLGLFGLGFG